MRKAAIVLRRNLRRLKLTALLFVFASFGGCSLMFGRAHSTDAELIENFQTRRAEFDQLLTMFLADKNLTRVAPDFTRPVDAQTVGADKNRIAEYRRLFERLNLSAGIEGYKNKDEVWLIASTAGIAVSGSSKGYAYRRTRPDSLKENLDTDRPKNGESFTVFRHIEGDWYLYFDYED